MKKKLFILITTIPILSFAYNFIDITKYGYEQYQDIVINGKVIKPATNNHRDCKARYNIIKKILDQI